MHVFSGVRHAYSEPRSVGGGLLPGLNKLFKTQLDRLKCIVANKCVFFPYEKLMFWTRFIFIFIFFAGGQRGFALAEYFGSLNLKCTTVLTTLF